MKIVVLAGGLSTERDVSINSASKVCKALREKGHQAVILDIFLGHGKTGDSLKGIFEGDPQLTQMSDTIQSVDPDLEAVKAAGLNTITPMLVCNSSDYSTFEKTTGKPVTNDDAVIRLAK